MGMPVSRATRPVKTGASKQPAQPRGCQLGVCSRVSRWFWWGNDSGHPQPPQPYLSQPEDCRACREWGVPCDHSKPQCSHCYQEQLLCFYVGRTQSKSTPKPTRSSHSVDPVPTMREPKLRKS